MSYNHSKHNRQSLRLAGWNYSCSGAYFVTICAYRRACLFGEVVAGRMFLNRRGRIVHDEWLRSKKIRREISLDAFVIMPNHFHGIVVISRPTSWLHATRPREGNNSRVYPENTRMRVEWPLTRQSKSLGSMIAGFKASVTARINRDRRMPEGKIWQRNYWDRVLRAEHEYRAARHYIQENPARWYRDHNHPRHL